MFIIFVVWVHIPKMSKCNYYLLLCHGVLTGSNPVLTTKHNVGFPSGNGMNLSK
jgi:hypothetical protein